MGPYALVMAHTLIVSRGYALLWCAYVPIWGSLSRNSISTTTVITKQCCATIQSKALHRVGTRAGAIRSCNAGNAEIESHQISFRAKENESTVRLAADFS